MSKETKALDGDAKALVAEIMATFEAYKQANDERLAEIESKGSADTLLDEKLKKMDRRLDVLSLKSARPEDANPDPQVPGHSEAWSRYLRAGDESG